MTTLKELNISAADLIKALFVTVPCLVTIGSAIWYFSAWSERVDLRLDDIDKDLRSIHQHYEHVNPRPAIDDYTSPKQ